LPEADRTPEPDRIRIDRWLWQARFFKTRGLAAATVESGRLRLNGQHCRKPGHAVGPGDTISFPQASVLRLIRVTACGTRRGPATEAQSLYLDLDTPAGSA
jgi:ribosomal 50S subunit-recycling heat shock protein